MEIFIVFLTVLFFIAVPSIIIPRFNMKHHADDLLKEMPIHERTTIYLAFSDIFPSGKKRAIDAKVSEMKDDEWTLLKMGEANPLRTLRSWGGGLNMHFIRPTL